MADMDAIHAFEGAPEDVTDFLALARILHNKLGHLIAGGGEADPRMRAILEFAAPHMRSEGISSSSVGGGAVRGELDPAMWSRLPEELLELVLARLPVPEVHRLRCLSKKWRRNLVEKSRFMDMCAKRKSMNVFALISQDVDRYGMFWVKMYDMDTNKWNVFKLFVGNSQEQPYQTMSSTDGGLVCFISAWVASQEYYFQLVVCNPLTQAVRKFIVEGLRTHLVEMLQIVTNRDTGHYKIIVVAALPDYSGHVARLFDSRTENWISLDRPAQGQALSCDPFFSPRYLWNWDSFLPEYTQIEGDSFGLCAWDFTRRNLNDLNDDSNPLAARWAVDEFGDCAYIKDRLFVLHKEGFIAKPDNDEDNADDDGFFSDNSDNGLNEHSGEFLVDRFSISEYQGQTRHDNWVKLRTIKCSPFALRPAKQYHGIRIFACEGFLLAVAYNDEWHNSYDDQIGWVYNLSTNKWRALPHLPGGVKLHDSKDNVLTELLVCKLSWDMDLNPLNVDAKRSFLRESALSDKL